MSVDTLSRVLEQNADSIVITDCDGVIEYVNPAFERMTGYTRDQAVGKTPRLLRAGIATPQFYETLWATILSGRPFHMTITNRRQDGRLFDQEETITPVRDPAGAITHFVATARDVTARQHGAGARLQRQLDAEGARVAAMLHDEAGQFFALAHITLAGLAGRLAPADAATVQEVRGYLDFVEERLREAARGAHPRSLAGGALEDAIRFVAREHERRTGARVTLRSSLDRPCPPSVESLLYRLVQEALQNAEGHAHATAVTIDLERQVGGRRAADVTISCVVHDNGVGFDASTLAASANRGRGLSAIQQRFKALGGVLEIVSLVGRGTELHARLPLEESAL